MEHLHKGAKWMFRIRAYSTLLFLIIFFSIWGGSFIFRINGESTGTLIGFSILFGVILAVVIGEIYARMAYKRWKYELTSKELKIEKGIIFKTYKSIPYERVQNVDIYRGILARMLGFSTLNIQTAGYHSYAGGRHGRGTMAEGHIPAVSVEGAEKIREFVMKRIGRRQGL